jgi:NAD(P)H-hydrate epimerase
MKILSASQIRAADAHTIANQPISSIDLMERAARACYSWFHQNISRKKTIALVCGKGNNGGDGLALARMLKAAGYQVNVFVVNHTPRISDDFATNYKRLETRNIAPINVTSANQLALADADIWVDALLGSGLNAPLTGLLAEVVSVLNSKPTQRISIDIPTGLFADDNGANNTKTIFKADVTLTFQCPKFSFMFPEFGRFAGHFVVLDIGLSPDFLREVDSPNHFVTEEVVKSMLPARQKFMHKGSFGHAYVVAGSIGKMGAAVLASKAALHSGAGLVTVCVPQCGVQILQTANPEIMVLPDMGIDFLTEISQLKNASAVGIGPGLGQAPETNVALVQFLQKTTVPMVLDADALNLLSASNNWHLLAKNTIVTPHLGELKRMLGIEVNGEKMYAHTAIYLPDGVVYFNSTGNPGMATAGSGDVLTGIITGLLAQGLSPKNAALVGVFYHGKAGDVAAQRFGERALIASALLNALRIE